LQIAADTTSCHIVVTNISKFVELPAFITNVGDSS